MCKIDIWKFDTVTAVTVSQFPNIFVLIYPLLQVSQMTYKCDMSHKIIMSHFQNISV